MSANKFPLIDIKLVNFHIISVDWFKGLTQLAKTVLTMIAYGLPFWNTVEYLGSCQISRMLGVGTMFLILATNYVAKV